MLPRIQFKPEYSYSPKMVPIAPAPDRKSLSLDLQQKKYTYKSTGNTGAQAVSIARRNARERNRVKQVNDGFNALRKRLPASVIAALSGGSRRGSGKKLSKVDTLRMVVEYIRYLESLIEESDAELGITKQQMMETTCDMDEGIYGGSPFSSPAPSPSSDCSSGISSAYSSVFIPTYQHHEEQMTPVDEDDLLDAISWWQQK